jgi:hypothetical protein
MKRSFLEFFQKSSLIGQFKFNQKTLKPIKTLQFKRRVGALTLVPLLYYVDTFYEENFGI